MELKTSMSMEAIREIWDGWRHGDTIDIISAKVGHEPRTVFDVAMQLEEVTPELEDEIILARSEGRKISEIREQLGVGYHAARFFCDGVHRSRRRPRKKRQTYTQMWDDITRPYKR